MKERRDSTGQIGKMLDQPRGDTAGAIPRANRARRRASWRGRTNRGAN